MKLPLVLMIAALAGFAPSAPQAPRLEFGTKEFNRFIFFAVLEGLYEDGVPEATVTRILERRANEGFYVHFVYACPICGPTVDAFRAYSRRQDFHYGWKQPDSAYLGGPLPPDLLQALENPDVSTFRNGLERLVQRFLNRRMDLLRFTPDDRKSVHAAMQTGRKQGMAGLPKFNPEMKKCPSCEAGVGATAPK